MDSPVYDYEETARTTPPRQSTIMFEQSHLSSPNQCSVAQIMDFLSEHMKQDHSNNDTSMDTVVRALNLVERDIRRVEAIIRSPLQRVPILPNAINYSLLAVEGKSPDVVCNRSKMKPLLELDNVVRSRKIYVPEELRCSIVGRILGPKGMTIRQLERDTGCIIRIQGEGSVRNTNRLEKLRRQRRWEHLNEPLSVNLTTTDTSVEKCEQKLNNGQEAIEALFTDQYDMFKQQQLIQYALIKGTYQPRNSNRKKSQL